MTLARCTIVFAAALLVAGAGLAPLAGATTPEHPKAASKPEKTDKHVKRKETKKEIKKDAKKDIKKDIKKDTKKEAKKDTKKTGHGAAPRKGAIHVALPAAPRRAFGAAPAAAAPAARAEVPARPILPLAPASSAMTSPLDLTAVKQAIALVHKGRGDEATNVEKTIIDPVARKLVEWVILRSDETTVDFSRYAAFIAANPSWPSIITLRYHAEAALWEQQLDPPTVIGYLTAEPPLSAKGYFALARAWLVKGDSGRAFTAVRTAWRHSGFSEDLEGQARAKFSGLITPADDKARMDARLYVGDDDAAMRAAQHLDAAAVAIAKARAAVNRKAGDAKALLASVPQQAQHDPGYIFSLIQYLRHANEIKDAAQWMLAAPRDPDALINTDQWWVERRLIARKLLDLGDARTAYEIADGAAQPTTENFRAEQQFTAGWIALEFLHQPSLALPHFARIAEGVVNPITLARSYYWQGRAAQMLGREQEARSYYETAARYPTAYYGQLARSKLRLDDLTPRELAAPPPSHRPLELARIFEILYAIDQSDMVAGMAADLGDKSTDVAGLASLAEITVRHSDARATLLIGKTALGRGLPLARYAFPDFGVPNYRQIGPQVERCVVFSIVRQESAFNPRVISSARALGLMQVTPGAGRNTARKFKVPFDEHRLLNDTAYNSQLGTAELGDDISGFRGSYILAFVAYNAGPGRARQWIEQYGDPRNPKVDPIDWIERIPISETRNYVERVLENMQVYRARLDNSSKLLIEADLHRGS
ncbi:MAG TPA: lytic transglycosylase domain-containing protein [Xanthobacteraceae bacterium]